MAHNVFISWSGHPSKEVALLLKEWLPNVIQRIEPFVSTEDIEKGARWETEIATALESCEIGIVCVTAKNQHAPWLNFEAGALSKKIASSRVCTLLLGIEQSQFTGPLTSFQATKVGSDDFWKVIKSINQSIGEPLPPERLTASFKRWWPEFEAGVQKEMSGYEQKAFIGDNKRSLDDMVEELIVTTRSSHSLLRRFEPAQTTIRDVQGQLAGMSTVLRYLGQYYGDSKKALSIDQFVNRAEDFDFDDWNVIRSSPFLEWYLTEHHGIRPKTVGTEMDREVDERRDDSMDDVPF